MSFFARVIYPNGGAGTYAVPFPYIDKSHIIVLENGAPYAGTVTWPTPSSVTLTPDPPSAHSVQIQRVTPEGSKLVSFAPGALSSDDLNLAQTQLLYLDQEGSDAGGGVAGVASINGRTGIVALTAADVTAGFGVGVGASLSAGLNITLSTVGGVTTISSTGGGGGGVAGVSSLNGRTGAVALTAADVTTGFNAAVAGALLAGSGVSLSVSGGITTINAPGVVSSVAGRTGAVALTAADVSSGFGAAVGAALVAGLNVSLSTSGGITTINASGGGGGGTIAVTHVGSNFYNSIGAAFFDMTIPPGAVAGDFAIVQAGDSAGQPTLPAAWRILSSGQVDGTTHYELVASKPLTSAEISAGVIRLSSLGGASVAGIAVYRGPTDAALGQQALVTGTTSPKTLSGFVKSAGNVGVVALYLDYSNTTATLPSAPFTSRYNTHSNWALGLSDALGATAYTDSTAISWTFTGTGHYSAFAVELLYTGGSSGVVSVAGRNGVVTLAAADVATGFNAAVLASLAAGSGISFSTFGGVTTISSTGGGGGSVSSVNGRTGAVALTAADVTSGFGTQVGSVLAAGAGMSLSTSGGITTITGGGSLPVGYVPAWENGITTGNTAATNTGNLNNLIATMAAAGGGTIWFNKPGSYQINGTINLKSFVSIKMVSGAFLTWTAGGSAAIFASSSTEVLVHCEYDINVDEGTSFSGIIFNFHSCQYNRMNLTAVGSNAGSVFVSLFADSTAGEFSWGGRNTVFNIFHFEHRGRCQYGLIMNGLTSGFGGQAQGVTDNEFHSIQFANIVFRGIKINEWADSNTFSGNTYIGLTGANGIGVVINEGRTNNYTVYNTHFEHLSIDTFGTGLARKGVVLFESKQMFCDEYFNDPEAEGGHFINTACLSYRWMTCLPATNNIYMHELGFTRGL